MKKSLIAFAITAALILPSIGFASNQPEKKPTQIPVKVYNQTNGTMVITYTYYNIDNSPTFTKSIPPMSGLWIYAPLSTRFGTSSLSSQIQNSGIIISKAISTIEKNNGSSIVSQNLIGEFKNSYECLPYKITNGVIISQPVLSENFLICSRAAVNVAPADKVPV